MDPRVLLIEGYTLYKFRLSQEQFDQWRVLDSTQPDHLKKDCIISSLSFLGLEERGKAEEIVLLLTLIKYFHFSTVKSLSIFRSKRQMRL